MNITVLHITINHFSQTIPLSFDHFNSLWPGLPVLDGGEQLSVGAAGGAHRLEGLDELVPLPLVSEAGVEIRGRQTEQPPVLVRAARVVRGLPVLEVGEHGLQRDENI